MEQLIPKRRWTLDKSGLESLLNAFDPDREQASQEYEALRERLIRFFEWNHTDAPEELADEALDRLAHRMSSNEGEILDPAKFAVGIARLLLKEHWRETCRKEEAIAAMAQCNREAARREQERVHQEERVAMLEQCLEAIAEPSRILIQRYFSAESRTQIQHRQKLAEEYGISANALRNRVMRIRMEVEKNFISLQSENLATAREINRQKLSR